MLSVILLLLFLLLGYIAQSFLSLHHQELWADRFNRFVIYISLPALVFVYMIDLEMDSRYILPIASAWGIFIFSSISILILSNIFNWGHTITGALLLSVPYGNTSFLGIPFVEAFWGHAGLPYAIMYDQLGSFLILSTAGLVTISIYSGQSISPVASLRKVLTFPAFLTLLIVIPLHSQQIPSWLMDTLIMLSRTLTPVALLSIGLYLKPKLDKHHIFPLAIGLGIKLILAPLILLIFINIFYSVDFISKVTVFESAMGPMVSSSMLAIMAGLERRFVASMLGYGIVISFITLPLWHIALRGI